MGSLFSLKKKIPKLKSLIFYLNYSVILGNLVTVEQVWYLLLLMIISNKGLVNTSD